MSGFIAKLNGDNVARIRKRILRHVYNVASKGVLMSKVPGINSGFRFEKKTDDILVGKMLIQKHVLI